MDIGEIVYCADVGRFHKAVLKAENTASGLYALLLKGQGHRVIFSLRASYHVQYIVNLYFYVIAFQGHQGGMEAIVVSVSYQTWAQFHSAAKHTNLLSRKCLCC